MRSNYFCNLNNLYLLFPFTRLVWPPLLHISTSVSAMTHLIPQLLRLESCFYRWHLWRCVVGCWTMAWYKISPNNKWRCCVTTLLVRYCIVWLLAYVQTGKLQLHFPFHCQVFRSLLGTAEILHAVCQLMPSINSHGYLHEAEIHPHFRVTHVIILSLRKGKVVVVIGSQWEEKQNMGGGNKAQILCLKRYKLCLKLWTCYFVENDIIVVIKCRHWILALWLQTILMQIWLCCNKKIS